MRRVPHPISPARFVSAILMLSTGIHHPPVPFIAAFRPSPYSRAITVTAKATATTKRSMALIPLPVDTLDTLLVLGVPTASQYSTYWGRNSRETYANLLESAIVTFLGVFLSYFLSFVIGGFIATILGFLFATWTILSPELRAYQRNWELLGGRQLVDVWTTNSEREGLYGALFLGIVQDISVVEDATDTREYEFQDFSDYTMEGDELEEETGLPYLLRVRLGDSKGRSIQVHARMSEEYLSMEPGQSVAGILLSTSPKFNQLSALTDFVVPDASCWIGDYPYLDRNTLEEYLAQDFWDILEEERIMYQGGDPTYNWRQTPRSDYDMIGFDEEEEFQSETVPVPRRRRRGGRRERSE